MVPLPSEVSQMNSILLLTMIETYEMRLLTCGVALLSAPFLVNSDPLIILLRFAVRLKQR